MGEYSSILDKLAHPSKLHLREGEPTPIAEAFNIHPSVFARLPQYVKVAMVQAVMAASN